MQKSTEAFTVCGVIATVAATVATVAPAIGGLISIGAVTVLWYGVRKARAERVILSLGGPPKHAALTAANDIDAEREAEEQRWRDDVEEFERLALDFWETLGARFANSDIHRLSMDFDSLTPTLATACWPDHEPPESDRDASLATRQVRELARRIYSLDGKSLFKSANEIYELDKLRQPMAQTLKRWRVTLEGAGRDRLAPLLREYLGSHHIQTLKLLWYTEAAKAESIKNDNPDYRPIETVRAALMPSKPDTEVPPSEWTTTKREIAQFMPKGSQSNFPHAWVTNLEVVNHQGFDLHLDVEAVWGRDKQEQRVSASGGGGKFTVPAQGREIIDRLDFTMTRRAFDAAGGRAWFLGSAQWIEVREVVRNVVLKTFEGHDGEAIRLRQALVQAIQDADGSPHYKVSAWYGKHANYECSHCSSFADLNKEQLVAHLAAKHDVNLPAEDARRFKQSE